MHRSATYFVVAATGLCLPVSAEVVFSSYGPNRSYNHSYLYSFGDVLPNSQAMFQFQPNASGPVTNVSVAAFASGTNRVGTIDIYQSNNNVIGSLLWSMNITLPLASGFPSAPEWNVSDGPILFADQQYFFTVRRTSPGSMQWWSTPGPPFLSTSLLASRVGNEPWSYIGDQPCAAFEVSIPAPVASYILALGSACLCFRTRSRTDSRL